MRHAFSKNKEELHACAETKSMRFSKTGKKCMPVQG